MLLLLLSIVSFCQQENRRLHDKDYYQRKSRSLQTTGWILAGTGAAATVAGIIIIRNTRSASDIDNGISNVLGGALLTTVGGAAVIASVPMFIFSGVMKKRGAMLSLQSQKILLPTQSNFVAKMQPAIGLTIHF